MPRLSELSSLGAPSGASRLAGASSLGGASGSYGMPEVAAYVVENASVLAQFGAKGDGITDDTPAFQAAVNSVASGKAIAIGVPSKTYLLNSDVVDNGRFPIFCIAPGAALTGAGVLRCRAEWWTDPYKKAHRGSIAWAFGGQRGGEGQGALLIGGGDPYEGLGGNYLFADGNGNWTAIITSRQDNPTEFNVYGASAGGRCTVLTGGNTITRQTGDLWTVNRVKYWIGRAIGLDYGIYVIDARIDDNTLRLKNIDGSAVVWNGNARLTYHFVLTTGDGTCTVAGTTVTRASGTPFNPFIDPSLYSFYTSTDGGTTWVKRTISAYVSPSQLTLSASLTAGSYLYRYEQDINQQIATVRIQKLNGGIEENLTLAAKTYEYEIRVGAGGSDPSDTGSYHPLTFYNGSTGPFAPKAMAQIGDGYVSLGGRLGSEALRAAYGADVVNRIEVYGGPSGYGASFRARGAQDDRDFNFDGTRRGGFNFSQDTFSRPLLTLRGSQDSSGAPNSDSYVEVCASSGFASVTVRGATNADLLLAPAGTGALRFGSYTAGTVSATGWITIKTASGAAVQLLAKV